jgi:hypothetical protein
METQRYQQILIGDTTRLYCVLDGASVPDLPVRLHETATPNYCLIRGELPPDLVHAAPYVAILLPGSTFTEWVFANCMKGNEGIFLHSRFSIKEMRRHFRGLFRVTDESGRPLMFRFYDPRVIRKFLPTCTASELTDFFGNVETYFVNSGDGNSLTKYRLSGGALEISEVV